jgi:septal ring factor EnvC (AmiA/AmiB activator)
VRARLAAGSFGGALAIAVSTLLVAQQQDSDPVRSRVDERLRALHEEANRLAGQARTLVVEVRKLEVERDIRVTEAQEADRALTGAKEDLDNTTRRLEALEEQRLKGLPDLESQLVETYKRGHSGYLRLLLSAGDLRGFARATRAVTALAFRQERVLSDYRATLDAVQHERSQLQSKLTELKTKDAAALRARSLADKAVADRAAMIEQIDSRRDLAAQYVGELQLAHERLDQQINGLAGDRHAAVPVPLAPFRGGLDWPVAGTVAARFGQPAGRLGGPLVRSGIEITALEGTPVHAVHGGTVGYAEGYTGLGTLVILDHGSNNFSLYGYLLSLNVQRGDTVEAGAEIGRVGPAPGGASALYFEMRIDGRSVDPVQWLKPR